MAFENPILGNGLDHISLEEIKEGLGPPPWSHAVVRTDHIAGTVIYQDSGETRNDWHCHNYDEWWVVLEGEIDWVVEGRDEPIQAKAGDFVFVPASTFHHIFPKGDGPTVRVGMALPGTGGHLHEKPERKARISIEQ